MIANLSYFYNFMWLQTKILCSSVYVFVNFGKQSLSFIVLYACYLFSLYILLHFICCVHTCLFILIKQVYDGMMHIYMIYLWSQTIITSFFVILLCWICFLFIAFLLVIIFIKLWFVEILVSFYIYFSYLLRSQIYYIKIGYCFIK
jgi:hypothetical protein